LVKEQGELHIFSQQLPTQLQKDGFINNMGMFKVQAPTSHGRQTDFQVTVQIFRQSMSPLQTNFLIQRSSKFKKEMAWR